MSKTNPLVGKTVIAVYLADDHHAIRFDLGGEPFIVRVEGDCCSHTWIESLDAPENLLGTVLAVEDIPMPNHGQAAEYEDDVIQYYGCKIITTKGTCVIDYRNESNGYYGGNLVWPDDYYYGGVFGQNTSTERWQLVAGTEIGR